MATLNEKEQQAELRLRLKGTEFFELEDHVLWTILKACEGNLDKAEKLLIKFFETRFKITGTKIISFKDYVPNVEISKCLKHKFLGYDRGGQPVFWAELGSWNFKELVNKGLRKEFFVAIFKLADHLVCQLYEESLKTKREMTFATVLVDLKGFSLAKFLDWETIWTVLWVSRNLEPLVGLIRQLYLVNCPRPFYYMFNAIKPFVPKTALANMNILDTNQNKWKKVLEKNFATDVIPKEYGGEGLRVFA